MLKHIATFLLLLSATIVWQPIAVAAPHCGDGGSGMSDMSGPMSGHDHQAMMAAEKSAPQQLMFCECEECDCDAACASGVSLTFAPEASSASWQPARFTRGAQPTIHAKAQAPLPYRPPII